MLKGKVNGSQIDAGGGRGLIRKMMAEDSLG